MAIGGNVSTLYMWKYGVVPGQRGSAVLAGHTCYFSCSNGVFDSLGSAQVGDRATTRIGKTTHWKVTRVYRHVQHRGSKFWASLYKTGGPARLNLITCTDPVPGSDGVYLTHAVVTLRKV